MLKPILSLRPKKLMEENIFHPAPIKHNEPRPQKTTIAKPLAPVIEKSKIADYDWDFVDEYDPFWPNEYEKLVKKNEKEKDKEARRDERAERNDRKRRHGHNNSNHNSRTDSPPNKFSGFGGRQNDERDSRSPPSTNNSNKVGVAIAPPPSLTEITIANDNGDRYVFILCFIRTPLSCLASL